MFVCACSFVVAALVQSAVDKTCCVHLSSDELGLLRDGHTVRGCREEMCVSMLAQIPQYLIMTAGEVATVSFLVSAF